MAPIRRNGEGYENGGKSGKRNSYTNQINRGDHAGGINYHIQFTQIGQANNSIRHQDMTNGQLLQAFIDGDRNAFWELFLRHHKTIYGQCYYFLRRFSPPLKDPEEYARKAMEEAFDVLYDKPFNVIKKHKVVSWLRAVAYKKCLNILRREKRICSIYTSSMDGKAPEEAIEKVIFHGDFHITKTPEEIVEEMEIHEKILAKLDELKRNYRWAVMLVVFMGYSYEEAARRMNKMGFRKKRGNEITAGDTRNWVHRGFKELRRKVEQLKILINPVAVLR